MTAKLFEDVVREWNGRLGQQGRRVLLCLDNFSGHPPELQLDNIQLLFFPPNTNIQFSTNGSGNHREPQAPLQKYSATSSARGHGHGKGV